MHLWPEEVRRQQQQLPIGEQRLWRVMSIFRGGYAGVAGGVNADVAAKI
jgi:hypothetical protein